MRKNLKTWYFSSNNYDDANKLSKIKIGQFLRKLCSFSNIYQICYSDRHFVLVALIVPGGCSASFHLGGTASFSIARCDPLYRLLCQE
jgi:hypothetical protein